MYAFITIVNLHSQKSTPNLTLIQVVAVFNRFSIEFQVRLPNLSLEGGNNNMTGNQIAYQAMLEARRANQARESENERHNYAQEQETWRHNYATETLGTLNFGETQRHNVQSEGITLQQLNETQRSNLAKELETHRSNLVKEMETQRSNMAHEAEVNRSNVVREVETERSNRAKESESRKDRAETYRHNKMTEEAKKTDQKIQAISEYANYRINAGKIVDSTLNTALSGLFNFFGSSKSGILTSSY